MAPATILLFICGAASARSLLSSASFASCSCESVSGEDDASEPAVSRFSSIACCLWCHRVCRNGCGLAAQIRPDEVASLLLNMRELCVPWRASMLAVTKYATFESEEKPQLYSRNADLLLSHRVFLDRQIGEQLAPVTTYGVHM